MDYEALFVIAFFSVLALEPELILVVVLGVLGILSSIVACFRRDP